MLLEVRDLWKRFQTGGEVTPVLTGVSFDLAAGGTLALEGESGSGKSTVLHLVAAMDQPDKGQISFDGKDVVGLSDTDAASLRRSEIGVIFQQFNLIPSLSVRDNVAFHARLAGNFDADWTAQLVERIGLGAQLDKYPEALSGGQQQRVAIARTLAARPKLILADEPTGNLDEDTADLVLTLMLECADEAGSAVLMVTHSKRLAARMEHRLLLSHGKVAPREETSLPGRTG